MNELKAVCHPSYQDQENGFPMQIKIGRIAGSPTYLPILAALSLANLSCSCYFLTAIFKSIFLSQCNKLKYCLWPPH